MWVRLVTQAEFQNNVNGSEISAISINDASLFDTPNKNDNHELSYSLI